MKGEIIRVEPLAYLKKVRGADFDRHPARDTIYVTGSVVRTRHGRDLRRYNRTPDGARAGTVEALCRDGRIIPGKTC